MEVKEININNIFPYEKNPRKNDSAVDAVASSIEEFGFQQPIVVDSDMIIVVGHTRYKAAKKLGYKTVPVVVAENLDEEQARAYRLADNKLNELSKWDLDLFAEEIAEIENIDMSLFGFGEIDIDGGESLDGIVDDDFDETEVEDKLDVKVGDIFQLGNHRLMCGSSTSEEDVDKLLDGNVMDMCITDPPYNINYEGLINGSEYKTKSRKHNNISNDFMDNNSFENFLRDFYTQMCKALKKGGAYYIWYADKILEFEVVLREFDLHRCVPLVWVKDRPTLSRSDYLNQYESCLYGWKNGASHYFTDSRKERTVFEDNNIPNYHNMKKAELIELLDDIYSDKESTDVIHEKKPNSSDLHPTMKPIPLFARLIRNSSKKEENVIDFFGGSGTTIMACEQLNRKAFVMELDPHYVEVIIYRWEKFTGEKAVKLN